MSADQYALPARQLPVQRGSRFSKKAETPSLVSSPDFTRSTAPGGDLSARGVRGVMSLGDR
jgi:hypothetical protein